MLKKLIITLVLSIILVGESFADKMGECTITPEIWSVGVLPDTKNSNNLTQDYASFEIAKGKKILIKGKVLDNNCVPISGVKVNIWQTNYFGLYQFSADDIYNEHYDKNFRGSGNTLTNNLGEFEFITVYPGKVNSMSPNIIFRLEHQNFYPFETKMFFPENNNAESIKNMNPYLIKKQIPLVVAKTAGKVDDMVVYHFIVTLNQSNLYKEY
jgi:protocatechuate 3,4-dioxygenase beta subunit